MYLRFENWFCVFERWFVFWELDLCFENWFVFWKLILCFENWFYVLKIILCFENWFQPKRTWSESVSDPSDIDDLYWNWGRRQFGKSPNLEIGHRFAKFGNVFPRQRFPLYGIRFKTKLATDKTISVELRH